MTITVDTSKMTVNHIRNVLMNEYDFTDARVNEIKGKKLLTEALNDAINEKNMTDEWVIQNTSTSLEQVDFEKDFIESDIEMHDTETTAIPDQDNNVSPSDSQWTDYVMKLLHDNEKKDGKPTVNGLRRIAYKMCGDSSFTSFVAKSPVNNDAGATVSCTIDFIGGNVFGAKRVGGSCDVFWGNIK